MPGQQAANGGDGGGGTNYRRYNSFNRAQVVVAEVVEEAYVIIRVDKPRSKPLLLESRKMVR